MKEIDVRIVITSLAPEPIEHKGKSGGAVRLVEILKRLHDRERTEVAIISTKHGARCFRENGVKAEYKIVKSNLRFRNFWGLGIKSILIVSKAFLSGNFDLSKDGRERVIVYSSSDLFWETMPAYLIKTGNKNSEWVQVIHHIYPNWKKRTGGKIANFFGYYLQRFSFWLIRRKVDRIIVLNGIVRDRLLKSGFPEKRIFLSSNGVNIDFFEKLEKSESVYSGVFLGRMSASKGVADLIGIWKNVCREISGAKLAVIGGGGSETKKSLQKEIDGLGLERNIDIFGFLEGSKAYPILKSGKIFLFPSHEEGWGIAIAEAMACGLPVVSWDLPVYREIFEGKTIQIKEGDKRAFVEKIIYLLQNDAMRKEIGETGKEFIRKHSWDEVAKKEWEIIKL